jgi:Fe2+ or Zn2+ uptake regulation protein
MIRYRFMEEHERGTTTGEEPGLRDDRFAQLLRRAGLRVTAPRLAVLRVLEAEAHADTEQVIRRVRSELGTVSHQAVYNVLAAFAEAGIVRRIEPAGSAALYELRVGDNHHHVVCRRCGAVADVDCAVGKRPCLTPSDAHGYLLDEAEVTFFGTCPACQRSLGNTAHGAPRGTTGGQARDRGAAGGRA